MLDTTKPLPSLLEAFDARLTRLEAQLGVGGASVSDADSVELAPQLQAYDEYVTQYLPLFLTACERLGEDARKLGEVMEKAFTAQRAFLLMASQCKKPATLEPKRLRDLQNCIGEANTLRDNRSEFANHQNMLSEGIQAMGWLCMERTPKPFVESFVEGLDIWGNKIRMQFKRSNPDQIVFVEAFKRLFVELTAYIKVYHLTGVTWNPRGCDVAVYAVRAPDKFTALSTDAGMATFIDGIQAKDQRSGKTACQENVNKGGLQTRRSELKADGAELLSHAANAPAAKKPAILVTTAKPPVCKQRNGNWQIEYQTGPEPLRVCGISMTQQVYIFGCEGATILLEGKAKNVMLDSCKRSKLIFDAAVSSVEVVNCTSVQVQCKGRVPSVVIDKTDGCLVYISWEGREVQFVTSKSSEMNVAFPKGPHSDDCVETPIPEQFVHKIMADFTVSSDVSSLFSHCKYE